MRLAVVTVTIGSDYEKLAEISHPSINVYASRVGADFVVIKSRSCPVSAYEKFHLGSLFQQYDRILYLDTDVLIRPDATDIFKLVPEGRLGAFNEAIDEDLRKKHQRLWTTYAKRLDADFGPCPAMHVNTGVLLLDSSHASLLEKPIEYIKDVDFEQTYFNLLLDRASVPVHCLSKSLNYNRELHPSSTYLTKAHILHYSSTLGDRRYKLMKFDAKEWGFSASKED